VTALTVAQQAFPHSSWLETSSLNSVLLLPHPSHLYSLLAGLSGSLRLPSSLQTAAPLAASALIAAAWQGAILVGLVALALRLIPRLSATVRSLVWTAVLALAVLLPLLPFAAHSDTATIATTHATLHLAEGWSFALAALWVAISLFKLAQLLRSAFHLAAISRRAVEIDPAELATFAPQIEALLHEGSRRPILCISDEVDRPSVAGFFFPRILLPVGLLDRVTPLELEQILRHEREHLNRADDWVNLAQKLALALFPLNPALLFIERQLANERELACDDTVLRETHAAKSYALCLANLAEMSLARKTALLALAAWHKRSELARRVERILLPSVAAMPRRAATTAGALITLLAVGSAATLAHAPALISFVPASSHTLAENPPIDAKELAFTQSLKPRRSFDSTTLAPHATLVNADARAMHPMHASALMMALPAKSQPAFAQFAQAPRPIRAIHTTQTTARPKNSAREISTFAPQPQLQPQQPQPVAHATLFRQVVATDTDGNTSWYMVATTYEVSDPNAQPIQPARQPTQRRSEAQPPRSVPAYAIVTPNGWLVLEM